MRPFSIFVFALLVTMWFPFSVSHVLHADDEVAKREDSATQLNKKEQASSESIARWVKQLGDDSVTTRQRARRQLTDAGQVAIPALAQAALSDKRDVIAHSIDILADIVTTTDDDKAREAARVTLKMLSESDQPSTAQRAKLALATKKDDGIQPFPGWDKPGSEFAGNRSAVNRSVSVSNINGLRTIVVTEGGKTTSLRDGRSGTIEVRIEEGEELEEFTVKNLNELKKKAPEAFALYQQFSGNAGGGVIARGFANNGVRGFGAFGQAGNQAMQRMHGGNAQQMMIRQLTELKQRMNDNPKMQQMLQQQIDDLQRAAKRAPDR